MELEGYELTMKATELAFKIRREVNNHPLISKYFHIADQGADGARRVPRHRVRGLWTAQFQLERRRRGLEQRRVRSRPDPADADLRHRRLRRHGIQELAGERFDIQINKTSRNSVLLQTNINNTRSDVALLIKVLADLSREIEQRLAQGPRRAGGFRRAGEILMTDVPDLPNFSRFHDAFREKPKSTSNEGDMRTPFFLAYDDANCEFIKLHSKEIDDRLKKGPELVSANFVIPYPPGFPIMVPGQVITADTIDVHAQARCEGDSRLSRRPGPEAAQTGGAGEEERQT